MKRLILPILLLCLLLCACGEDPTGNHDRHGESEPAVSPTEPGGSYLPDSPVEVSTLGAVRAYPMNQPNTYAVVPMGEDVLVFSGKETTTLTRLSGENLYVTASNQLPCLIAPEDPAVQVSAEGVVYYDSDSFELVILDTTLEETDRIGLPEETVGRPIRSLDGNYVYYCTPTGLRCLELDSGISRLLKEFSYPQQSVTGVLLDGSVVSCAIRDEHGFEKIFYLSTENGQTLESGSGMTVSTLGEQYYAVLPGNLMHSFVYGTQGETPRMLIPARFDANGCFLPEQAQFVSMAEEENVTTLALYDLTSGKRLSQVKLEDCGMVRSVSHRGSGEQIYILCADPETGAMTLCRWDTTKTALNDGAVYTGEYHTADNPDTEGLAQCRTLAEEIGNRHGVRITIADAAVAAEPWAYDLEMEYRVPVILRELGELDQLLASYPEGFLAAAAEATDAGRITICLVRSITGSAESGNLTTESGIQFRHEGNIYVALAVGGALEDQLYYQMYYAIETRLLSNSNDCYEWNKLNPKKFAYDYDYAVTDQRTDTKYLEGDNRYFIDGRAMYSPSEDRALIMKYAMQPGCEEMFQSKYMQKKLRTLCTGLREAFGLKQSPETFLWEQYLNESLAYTG